MVSGAPFSSGEDRCRLEQGTRDFLVFGFRWGGRIMVTLWLTQRLKFWRVLLLATWLFGARGLDAADRAPVPSAAAQNEALALVKDVYGGEYADAESADQKTALAQKLLQKAKATDQGTANHYALLRVAWDVATQAGDAKVAMQITDAIVGAYEINALSSKMATVRATAESVRSSTQRTALATIAMDLFDEAVAGDDYGAATELAETALAAARKAQDWQLVKQIVARDRAVKEMAGAYETAQKALATLEDDPTNSDANQVAGEFFCFFKKDWMKGIPMLALGSDVALKTLAQKDLKGASSPNEQVELGDGWWELAQTHEGDRRDILLLRAGSWYAAGKAGVSGLTLDKVDKRLKEIGRIGRPAPEALTAGRASRRGHDLLFRFNDEALAKQYWEWTGEWTMANDGGRAPKANSCLRTRHAYHGNLSIDMDFSYGRATYTNTGGSWIEVWGKRLTISNKNWGSLHAQVHIHREGDEIVFVLNGQVERVPIDSDKWREPTVIDIRWRSRTSHFRGIRIRAQTMVPPNSPPIKSPW